MKITAMSHILNFFILTLICVFPFTTYAQQSSASTSTQVEAAELFIADNAGIDDVDAQSAAMLIAAEFRKLGIAVNDPVFEVTHPEIYIALLSAV